MNGKKVMVCDFVHTLRKRLWLQHLGLPHTEDADQLVRDAIHPNTYWGLWHKFALNNSQIYETVFKNLPSQVVSLNQFYRNIEKRPDGEVRSYHSVRLEGMERSRHETWIFSAPLDLFLIFIPFDRSRRGERGIYFAAIRKIPQGGTRTGDIFPSRLLPQ